MLVAVVGGGITGLAAAWELQSRGIDYVVLEASDRLGGKIVTERADGFVIEGAADAFLTQKPWAWQLCREIGLGDRLIGTNDAQRTVYVLRGGRLHPMPRGMRLIVPLDAAGLLESDLLSPEGKGRMLAEPEIPARQEAGDESLASFVRRRFGEEALEVFGNSLLAGIHVGDSERLSLQATFPNYAALESAHGSITRAALAAAPAPGAAGAPSSMFVSFPSGVSELVEGLQAHLTGDLRTGTAVSRLDPDGVLRTGTGEVIKAGAVVLTVPPGQAGDLLREIAPELAWELGVLRTESSATVSLGFRAEQVGRPLDGFGFVVPHSEPTHLLACTWSSTKWPHRAPEGHVLLRATSSVDNRGRGPLELRARRLGVHRWAVYQAIYDERGHVHLAPTRVQLVFKFVPGERYGYGYVGAASYWKVRHVASFQLWSLSADLVPQALVRVGPKVDYCLRDLFRTAPLAHSPLEPVYPGCSQDPGIRRDVLGTSVGWSDVYPYGYPEQWIDVTGLRGRFAFVMRADPDGLIIESNHANDVSETFLELPSGRVLGHRVGIASP